MMRPDLTYHHRIPLVVLVDKNGEIDGEMDAEVESGEEIVIGRRRWKTFELLVGTIWTPAGSFAVLAQLGIRGRKTIFPEGSLPAPLMDWGRDVLRTEGEHLCTVALAILAGQEGGAAWN